MLSKLKLLFILGLVIASCQAYASSIIHCGYGIINIHEKNDDLIGYAIQQEPKRKDHRDYKDAHPYIVVFIFESGPSHIVFYSPSGQVIGGEWEELAKDHEIRKNIQPISSLWHECRGSNLPKT